VMHMMHKPRSEHMHGIGEHDMRVCHTQMDAHNMPLACGDMRIWGMCGIR
jgi:hypothetical protein